VADDNAIVARRWASSAPRIAAEAAASADLNATVTEEIAQLAEQVASSATAAAARARLAADDAKKAARVNRDGPLAQADEAKQSNPCIRGRRSQRVSRGRGQRSTAQRRLGLTDS
jgi:hypothetical protein